MSKPQVSIVVPCFNYGHFLPDTLNGILAQDFSFWECIIVDDGSSDNTSEVAALYVRKDARIRYLHQANGGLSAARNAGLSAANGSYIQLLDADDSIAPAKLRLQVGYLEDHPEADLVYGDALYFSEDISRLQETRLDSSGNRHLRRSACGNALVEMLMKDNIMEVSCPLIRRSLVKRTGLFDPSYKSFEDWQYWFRGAVGGACFHYWPQPGTETFIRYGHASMMRHLRRMNEAGIHIRHYMQQHLHGSQSWYNRYRLVRLHLKKLWLSLQR